VKAITAANAQAAYSTNRANAQAAHDAALLSAMKDWRESSSAANLKSLVSSSQAENDFKASVAGFWADWNTATEGNDRWAPTGFLGSVTDSVMGLMNPFDTDSIARSLTTETKADTTNGPQRPKPSDIHVVYSIYGIVSEHTPEEWEVIREYQTKGRTWEEWMMGGERKRMDAAGFKTSFRKLEEDVPPAKVLPTPSPPSPAPVTPVLSNPILTPLDANNELMVSRDDFDLDITDTILGIIGGTRGDYIDESFNFLYGVGDNMSLGLGWWLRSTFFHDQADYGGSSYYIGGWVGFAGDLLMGVGAFKALGKTFGREAFESGLRNAPVNAATRGKSSGWFDFWADRGGVTEAVSYGSKYGGNLHWANKLGLRQGYETVVKNFDAAGTWFARTDTAVHEGFHALVGRHFPTIWKLGDSKLLGVPIGAPVKYMEEVLAYGLGRGASLRLHGVPLAPLEAFGSLSRAEGITTIVFGVGVGAYGLYEYFNY
jgi:hypothetical protein